METSGSQQELPLLMKSKAHLPSRISLVTAISD